MSIWFVKNKICEICGEEFTIFHASTLYCDRCKKKYGYGTKVMRGFLGKIQELLSKAPDRMSMADHWLKSFYLENRKTMKELEAYEKAVKKVRKIQLNNWRKLNNMTVKFSAKERKNMRENSKRWFKNPHDKQTQREEEILKRFGY